MSSRRLFLGLAYIDVSYRMLNFFRTFSLPVTDTMDIVEGLFVGSSRGHVADT